ncbi:MAG: hypothetical protein AAB420_00140 [Patescibacteria group bacterium]
MTKWLIGGLVAINVLLLGLLIFRDQSTVPPALPELASHWKDDEDIARLEQAYQWQARLGTPEAKLLAGNIADRLNWYLGQSSDVWNMSHNFEEVEYARLAGEVMDWTEKADASLETKRQRAISVLTNLRGYHYATSPWAKQVAQVMMAARVASAPAITPESTPTVSGPVPAKPAMAKAKAKKPTRRAFATPTPDPLRDVQREVRNLKWKIEDLVRDSRLRATPTPPPFLPERSPKRLPQVRPQRSDNY